MDDELDEPPAYQPRNPLGVVRTCAMALLNHGVLPVAGGVLDQPETLWIDMMVFINAMQERMEELRPEVDTNKGEPLFTQDDDSPRLGLW